MLSRTHLQGCDEIGHADVDRIGIGGTADLGEVEEAEDVQAVIDETCTTS